jgi:hypothetical protein
MTEDQTTHQADPAEPGRVEALLERSPFWFEVAHGVTSAVTAAFIVAWIGSTVVLAAQGEVGSDVRWDAAISWSVLFVALGASVACLAVLAFAAADYPRDPTRRRGMVVAAVACSWVLSLAGTVIVPEDATDAVVTLLVATLVLGVASSVAVMSRGRPTTPTRSADWTDTFWRVAHLAVGLTTALMATTLTGLALAVIFQRATE